MGVLKGEGILLLTIAGVVLAFSLLLHWLAGYAATSEVVVWWGSYFLAIGIPPKRNSASALRDASEAVCYLFYKRSPSNQPQYFLT